MLAEVNYSVFTDALGGIATVVLAIIALSGVRPDVFVAITTIVFGAALLLHGGGILSEYAQLMFPSSGTAVSAQEFNGGSIAAVFLVGAAGIVLGILALIGKFPMELTGAAVIAFGAALILGSTAVSQVYMLRRPEGTAGPRDLIAHQLTSGSAGIQAVSGLTAIVLGILAVIGIVQATLILVALLVVGASILVSGSAMSGTMLNFVRPMHEPTSTSSFTSGRETM
jgi:hypothetical protein